MEMQIGNLFALMKYTYPSEEYFYDKLFSAELLDADKFAGEAAGAAARGARRAAAGEKDEGERAARRNSPPGRAKDPPKPPKPERAEEKAPRHRGGDHRGRTRRLPDRGGHRRPLHGPALPLHGQDRRGADARRTTRWPQFQNPLLEQAARDYAGKPEGELTVADLKGPHGAVCLRRPVLVCRPAARAWRPRPPALRRRRSIDPLRPDRHRAARGHPRPVRPRVFSEPDGELSLAIPVADLARESARLRCGGVRCQCQPAHESCRASSSCRSSRRSLADGNAVTDLTGLGRCLNVRTLQPQRCERVRAVRAARADKAAGRHALALHAPRAAHPAAQILAHTHHARGLRPAGRFLPQL